MSNYQVVARNFLLTAAADDQAWIVARLDIEYQVAVGRNDWRTMDRILHPDCTRVRGDGSVASRTALIDAARRREFTFEKQVEMPGTQTVRMFGNDTATVTALLWVKGQRTDSSTFDHKLWFTDTYARTPKGWLYSFGHASTPI